MADNRILLIRTGGTIDSEPYEDPYNAPDFVSTLKGDHSLITQTVRKLPNHDRVDHFSWVARDEDRFVRDSQELNHDKEALYELARIIREDSRRYFVLTHGTDAMAENAAELQKYLRGTNKVVVFTGSMVPLSMQDKMPDHREVDGIEALRFTLERMTSRPAGVYITGYGASNGRKELAFFDPLRVEKDRPESKASLQFTLKPAKGR